MLFLVDERSRGERKAPVGHVKSPVNVPPHEHICTPSSEILPREKKGAAMVLVEGEV